MYFYKGRFYYDYGFLLEGIEVGCVLEGKVDICVC